MPLFAQSQAPMRVGRLAASLSVTALDHGGKQKLRFGGDDPDASRLLKNRGRRVDAVTTFLWEGFRSLRRLRAAYLSSATMRTMLSNSFSTSGWFLVR